MHGDNNMMYCVQCVAPLAVMQKILVNFMNPLPLLYWLVSILSG